MKRRTGARWQLALLWSLQQAMGASPGCELPTGEWLEPTYHLTPAQINSTHCADAAAVVLLDGTWHWFVGCDGGWRHIVSQGLVDWAWADPLLVTGQGGDTGSVAVTPSGVYLLIPGCGGLCRRVALDRSLTRWSPVAPAAGTQSHPSNFRDPSRPFQRSDGRWYVVVGSGLTHGEKFDQMTGPLAFGMMFVADDDSLASWKFVSYLHTRNQTRAGVSIDTFECPDVWPLPSPAGVELVVFEASMCSDTCEPPACNPKPGPKPYPIGSWNTHGEELWIGAIDPVDSVLRPTEHTAVDYGAYYASKTAAGSDLQSGRRVLFGYIEASVNRRSDGANEWSCGQKLVEPEALPREVSLLSGPDGVPSISFKPVDELKALRIAASEVSRQNLTLTCGSAVPLGSLGHAVEIRAVLGLQAGASPDGVHLGVTVLASAVEATQIGLDLSAGEFFVDKRRSTLRNATPPVFKDRMTAPFEGKLGGNLTVYLDGRAVETYVAGKVLTTLIYPSLNASSQLGLFMSCAGNDNERRATASVSAWALRPINVTKSNDTIDTTLSQY